MTRDYRVRAYLHELSVHLSVGSLQARRILAEVRDHLLREVDKEQASGLDREEAEAVAIRKFGEARSIAQRFKPDPSQLTQPYLHRTLRASKRLDSNVQGAASVSVHRAFRRYPSFALLTVAVALAVLLPSALNIPNSNPSTLSEFAPVPGTGSGRSDISSFGASTSGARGAGAGTATVPDLSSIGVPSQKRPKLKRCVGDPPRQTEDPMSPACVAYFEGDNFGTTHKGVEGDEIRVAVVFSCRSDGSFDVLDYANASHDPEDPRKAWVSHFNERYQTYGRRVRVLKVYESSGTGLSCASGPHARSVPRRIQELVDPFYVFHFAPFSFSQEFAEEAARLGMMVSLWGHSPSFARRNAPFIVSYTPDLRDWAANAGAALCARLAGRTARFAGDADLRTRVRKFGLAYQRPQDPQREGPRLVAEQVSSRCGDEVGEIVEAPPTTAGMAKMRGEHVTTVLSSQAGVQYLAAAEQAGFHPEWFDLGELTRYRLTTQVSPPTQTRNAFGLVPERRYGDRRRQPHREAFEEGCPGCPYNYTADPYHEFLLLFTGIQAAGPLLTPENFEKGLHALPARRSTNPYVQSAYFGPGDYSFVKDYAFGWWDPTGEAPEGAGPGCWRLVEDGLRYRSEDWRSAPGEGGIQQRSPEQPCQGEP